MKPGISDPTWEDGIKSSFSEADRKAIRVLGINPDDYHDVAVHADKICEMAEAGPNQWSQAKLARFRLWIHSGMLKGARGLRTMTPAAPKLAAPAPGSKAAALPPPGKPQYDIARILGSRGALLQQSEATMTATMSAWSAFGDELRQNWKLRRASQTRMPADLAEHARFALTVYADFLQALANVPTKGALWYYAELTRLRDRDGPTL